MDLNLRVLEDDVAFVPNRIEVQSTAIELDQRTERRLRMRYGNMLSLLPNARRRYIRLLEEVREVLSEKSCSLQ